MPLNPKRRYILTLVLASLVAVVLFVSYSRNLPTTIRSSSNNVLQAGTTSPDSHKDSPSLKGPSIMPALGNETAKAELGRATWKYFHTVMSRFPDTPTAEESSTLKTYIHLFQRLYPCGECSEHFGKILEKFPPQTSSRSAAAVWACHVHNEVNKSLGKEVFDCSKIGDFYDCGCAEEDGGKGKEGQVEVKRKGEEVIDGRYEKPEMSKKSKEMMTGANGRSFNMELLKGDRS